MDKTCSYFLSKNRCLVNNIGKNLSRVMYRHRLVFNIFINCWCCFNNFQIIIGKDKCNVSGRPILELIRIFHINSLKKIVK